jgi:hypothetical protein
VRRGSGHGPTAADRRALLNRAVACAGGRGGRGRGDVRPCSQPATHACIRAHACVAGCPPMRVIGGAWSGVPFKCICSIDSIMVQPRPHCATLSSARSEYLHKKHAVLGRGGLVGWGWG